MVGLCSQAHVVTLVVSCAELELGLDNPGVSLLTQDILWLCDSKPIPHSAGNENSDLISWPSPDRLPSGGEVGNWFLTVTQCRHLQPSPDSNYQSTCTESGRNLRPKFHACDQIHVSSKDLCGWKSCGLPLPPRLQHFLHCSFKEFLIILKMVFLVLITLKNVAKQEYHLLKQKSASQPLLLSFCHQSVTPVTTSWQIVTINGTNLGYCFV